jgi:serine/threonine protein kinase
MVSSERPPPAHSSLLVSGTFLIGELLGTGGSASVFAATDTVASRTVALKILHPHLAADPEYQKAFFREALIAEPLDHPNLVAVLDHGVDTTGGVSLAWIALEYLPGLSLGEWVETSGPLSVDEALAVAEGVLTGLAAMHAAGLVHRDISPSNIVLVAEPGQPLTAAHTHLLDFGLTDVPGRTTRSTNVLRAPRAGGGADADGSDVDVDADADADSDAGGSRDAGADADGPDDAAADDAAPNLSTDGGVLGSIHYLSPEQAQGLPVDERGDLYEVGAVLYFALTGRVPYPRDTSAEVLSAHVHAPPPVPSVTRAGIPRAADRVVVKGMLKDRDARFATADAMLQAVQAARSSRVTTRTVPVPYSSQPNTETARTRVLPAYTGRQRPGTTAVRSALGAATALSLRSPSSPSPSLERDSSSAFSSLPPTRRRALVASLATLGIVGAITIVWSLGLAGGTPKPLAVTTPSPTASATIFPPTPTVPAPAASVSLAATQAALVDLTMMSLGDARAALENQGMVVGVLNVENSVYAGDTVLAMSPIPGTLTDVGTPVQLSVASGSNVVPSVVGVTGAEAIAALRQAGMMATIAASDAPFRVVEMRPVAGTVLRLGTTVDVVVAPASPGVPVASPAPTPVATPTSVPTPPPAPVPALPTATPTPLPAGP